MLLAGADDADSARLARRNGAVLVGTAGDGAPPLVDLAARCAELLAPAPAKPPARRRGPQPGSRTAEARRLAADLARAVACRELALHFQPTVDLRSGRVLGAEALARWPHPARGHIPPADFIPVAERSGLILDLGAWALADAVAEAARWGHRHLRVSVNVSPRQIEAGVLPAQVRRALDAGHLDPARLQIEITEGVLLETSTRTIQALAAVRAMGVGIALDDFGTGYASLAAVRRLPLTALKIDRSFVAGLGQDAEDSAIVRAMVEMAGALRLDIVAEGVENDRQRVALIGLGIREGQGWLFGRPAPPLALARHFGT
jgi:EAL domain-containing protein (putative c-di-GMP-specific phosphodiesterase class I)